MIKGFKIVVIISLLSTSSVGQQLFNYTHSLISPGLQNPSFTSYNDEMNFTLLRKSVYGNIDGAPEDNSFYFSTPLNSKNGMGLFLNQNTQGIFKELNASLQYGRSFQITEFLKLGLGVSAGVKNQTINLDEVIAFDSNDPFLVLGGNRNTTYDASFGMYLSSSNLLLRVSVPQMIGNRFGNDYEKLNQHILSNVQYKIYLKNSFVITPSMGVDYTINAPLSFNGGFLISYKELFWVGALYKSDYAISPMAGLSFKNVSLSYAYDYTQMNYSNLGLSHEIMLQYTIHRNVNKVGNISPEAAEEKVFELIDEYFDVQNSDIDLLERMDLMKGIQKEIDALLPFLDKARKQQLRKKMKSKKQT